MSGPSRLALALLHVLSCCLSGCHPPPTACGSPGICPPGTECIANRCAVAGEDPAPQTSARTVQQPSVVGLVSARTRRSGGRELPAGVSFGSSAEGAVALYLELPRGWRRRGHVHAAFLVLAPLPDAPAGGADIEITVARVESTWDRARLSWTVQPKHGFPLSRGVARARPPSPLRIDVTEALRFLAEHPSADHGLVLKAAAGDDHGASYSLGAGVGSAPRLEVYWDD